jgi:hypothetical protein
MYTKRSLRVVFVLILATLAACTTREAAPTPTEEMIQPTEPQESPTETEIDDPAANPEGVPCLSQTLGLQLIMPGPDWVCEVTNDSWLKLTSPLFEVNISNLGRGPFCNPGLDDSCQMTPFYANDVVNLQLFTAEDQPREIFGPAEFSDPQASVWVAITWQDMANHSLTEAEVSEIQQLVSSLSLLGQ